MTKKELLKALGMEASGIPVAAKRSYVSKKKSVQVKKRNFSDKDVFADDSSLENFVKRLTWMLQKPSGDEKKKR